MISQIREDPIPKILPPLNIVNAVAAISPTKANIITAIPLVSAINPRLNTNKAVNKINYLRLFTQSQLR